MPRRTVVLAAAIVVAAVGGGAFALGTGSSSPRHRTAARRALPRRPSTTRRHPATTAHPSTTSTTTTTTQAAPTTAPTTLPPAPVAPPSVPAAPAPPVAGLAAVRGRTITIDAGHDGGNAAHASEIARPIFIGTGTRACDTTGTETDDGYTESAYNLDVALRLRDLLQAAGANVVMVRTTDTGWGPCIDERAAIGNRAHSAVAISIHADGGPAGGRGFHVNMPALVPGYTDDIYGASHRLGVDVRDALLATGMPPSTYFGSDGLVERSDLGGLNLSDVPKVLVEMGNMRNATDAALLERPDFRARQALDLALGIAGYLSGR